MILVGRSWCGIFARKARLQRMGQRHGRGASVLRWAKWRGLAVHRILPDDRLPASW